MEQIKIKNSKNETVKAGCIVLNDKNEVLLVSSIKGGVWSFPKGHMENGEDPKDTATREVVEETGYKVELIRKLPDISYKIEVKDELVKIIMFLAKPIEKIDAIEKEIKSGWFEVEKAREIIYPNLIPALNNL
jgi:8-oxo-dGTP pyrophosphatase MutT (NUDIX family)